jgi:hypothetical protein
VEPEVSLSNAREAAVWAVGRNYVWGVPIDRDAANGEYAYDPERHVFRKVTGTVTTPGVPGFESAAAIDDELWLSRADGEVIHAHVGP